MRAGIAGGVLSSGSRPPAMTLRRLLDAAVARLDAAGVEGARRSAEWIVEHVTGASRATVYARPATPVSLAQQRHAERLVARRAAGEPVQYVLGEAEFFGRPFGVAPAVLIPRPETEEVVEHALACLRGAEAPWVLDVGTGSGAIAVTVKAERPDAEVFAVDVSPEALDVARRNAERLGAAVTFVLADALRPALAAEVPPTFDLVVSNPPYVPDAERAGLQAEVRWEPELALFVPDADPLRFYRALAGHALALLKPGGWLVAETHADHGRAVAELFAEAGLADAEIRADLAGRDRIASARRVG